MDETRLVESIGSVATAVREAKARTTAAHDQMIDALRGMAETLSAQYEAEIDALTKRVEANLLPEDPLRQTWNVFRMFGSEYKETRWTQWFAALLRLENGVRAARLAWCSFCEALAIQADRIPPTNDAANANIWRLASAEHAIIEDEVQDKEYGRLDLLIETPSLVAVVENKLWEDWHDGSKMPQADRYREIGRKRVAGSAKKLALVLLSQREGISTNDYPPDYVHVSWRDVGRQMRRRLRSEWDGDQRTAIDLWPIVLTLNSIECDLVGFSLDSTSSSKSARLREFEALATYLEGADQ